jgi:hypothetical protein
MNLAEWHQVLATELATPNQVGAVQGHFERLGFRRYLSPRRPGDRAERLAISAELLGLDELESSRQLTQGQAGRLLRLLQDCPDRASLLAAAETSPVTVPGGADLADSLGQLAMVAAVAAMARQIMDHLRQLRAA